MNLHHDNRKMRVLLTGAGGQLGQAMVHCAPPCVNLYAYSHAQLDVTQHHAVQTAFEKKQFDLVINASAYNNVDRAEQEPLKAHAVNCDGVGYLAQAAQEHSAALIHISTDYVFDGRSSKPYTEADTPHPLNVYGAGKYAGEQVLLETLEQALIVRTSSVFSGSSHNFVTRIIKAGMQHGTLHVVNDQVSCPTAACDLASALWQLVQRYGHDQKLPWGVLHYTGTPACSRYEWACEVIAMARAQGVITHPVNVFPCSTVRKSTHSIKATRPAYSVLDSTRIQTLCGIDCVDWQTACREVLSELIRQIDHLGDTSGKAR